MMSQCILPFKRNITIIKMKNKNENFINLRSIKEKREKGNKLMYCYSSFAKKHLNTSNKN